MVPTNKLHSDPNAKPSSKRRRIGLLLVTMLLFVSIAAMLNMLPKGFTTNHASLDAEAEDTNLRPVTLGSSIDHAADRIEAWAQAQSSWNVIRRSSDQKKIRLHLTHVTRFMQFVDDVHVRIEPLAEGSIVYAESKSRVGKGDFGQNARNLRELTRELQSASN